MIGLPRLSLISSLLAAALFAALPAAAEVVTFDANGTTLTAELFRPAGTGPFPAVIAMHGCSGLYTRNRTRMSARHEDWAQRLVAAGYVVLFPDSFNPRGYAQICTKDHRPITPKDRADDALAAARWLTARPDVDGTRLSLLGWSHGAMSVLWTVRPDFLPAAPRFAHAFAFYPGCREIARLPGWQPSVPLTVLSGGADDWTQPAPCRELARTTGFHFIEYPGAYHDFDAPGIAVHVRTGLSSVKSGKAHIGTDPQAREAAIAEVMTTLAAMK